MSNIKAILYMYSMYTWIVLSWGGKDMSWGVYTPLLWVQTASGCSSQPIDWLEESQDAMGSGPNATNFGLSSTLAYNQQLQS